MFSSSLRSQFISLHNSDWLIKQKIAGQCVSECLQESKKLISSAQKLTGKDVESLCLSIMTKHDCTPTFFGYRGFPGAICLSVNNELVHGIPNNKLFISSDVIKVDLGATYQGAIADAAITTIYGTPKSPKHVELIIACQKALDVGIQAVKIENRIGEIGYAIHNSVRRTEFKLITDYGGHGIEENVPHASPFVPNKSQKNEGPRIQSGISLAIEPMLVLGDNRTRVSKQNGWAVLTDGIGAHFEHTLYVDENEVLIITK
jgi:methionyl aminopeptidase